MLPLPSPGGIARLMGHSFFLCLHGDSELAGPVSPPPAPVLPRPPQGQPQRRCIDYLLELTLGDLRPAPSLFIPAEHPLLVVPLRGQCCEV